MDFKACRESTQMLLSMLIGFMKSVLNLATHFPEPSKLNGFSYLYYAS